MEFASVLKMTLEDKAPEGWKQKLSLTQYAALDDERRNYYSPLYAKYRTKKFRDYDFDTGQFVGWTPRQVGIGEPVGYKYHGVLTARYLDSVMKSNVLMQRVMHPRNW